MELWTLWLDALRALLTYLSSSVGLGAGFGIVALTLLLRSALLPVSWSSAYRGCIRQKQMTVLQPKLAQLKERFAQQPQVLLEKTMAVYRKHGLSPIDGRSLFGAVVQLPLFAGMFQILREGANGVRFLWVQSLAKPDVWLAVISGLTTVLMMSLNPDLPEGMRMFIIIVPAVFAVAAALKFSSALAVYWAASNSFSAMQTFVLHRVVNGRIRSGALKI